MIIVHVNCSYTLSPAGFWYGSFRYNEQESAEGAFYSLSEEYNRSFVQKSFDHGFLLKTQGLIPGKTTWLYLIKGFTYTYENHEEKGSRVEVNIGFEFDDQSEFGIFSANMDRDIQKEEISRRLADLVIPDLDDKEYGLHIDKGRMDAFIKEELQMEMPVVSDESMRFVVHQEYIDYTETIAEVFHLSRTQIRYDGYEYVYSLRTSRFADFFRKLFA